MSRFPSLYRWQRLACGGFVLPSAIFLLVILASLAAFLVNISTTQSRTSVQDMQGARAYHAARAGIEWGLYQVMVPAAPSCVAATILPAAIEGFTVTVTCAVFGPYSEAGQAFSLYRLEATAQSPGAAPGALGFVERQVSASVSR